MSTGAITGQPTAPVPPPVEAARTPPTGPNDPPSPLPEPVVPIIGEEPAVSKDTPGSIIGEDKPPVKEPEAKPAIVEGAPKEGYKDFTLPKGVELDKEMLDEAKTFMSKDLNLTQDKAQKLVDFHVKALQGMAEAPYQLWADTQREWQAEVAKDAELGGSNLPQVKTRIAKLLDEHGDPKVREALAFTGAGNHPAIIRTLNNLAKLLTEGAFIPGGGGVNPERTAAQVLYPTMNKGN